MSMINIALIFTVLILYFLCLYFQKQEKKHHLEVVLIQENLIIFRDVDSKEIISLKGDCERV